MPIKLIGRTTNFQGKTLWEILGNLKNFGIGRVVVRSTFERYPEPSYMKICKVEPLPDVDPRSHEEVRKVRVVVEKVFRGRKYPTLTEICSASYKADYRLIPKDEEEAYCEFNSTKNTKVMPQTTTFPPLYRELLLRDMKMMGQPMDKEPMMKLKFRSGRDNIARVPVDGEVPTTEICMGLGKPASPQLYKDISS